MQNIIVLLKRPIVKIIKLIFEYRINKSISHENPPTIISSNCVGGRIYEASKLKYASPTVGVWFEPEDFYKFVTNLSYYLKLELKPIRSNEENYPLAILGDVKVHLMHYKSFEEASVVWKRRSARVNLTNIIIINTDRDGCSQENLIKLHRNSPYRTISFVSKRIESEFDYIIKLKVYSKEESVGDLYTNYQHLTFNFPYEIFKRG